MTVIHKKKKKKKNGGLERMELDPVLPISSFLIESCAGVTSELILGEFNMLKVRDMHCRCSCLFFVPRQALIYVRLHL